MNKAVNGSLVTVLIFCSVCLTEPSPASSTYKSGVPDKYFFTIFDKSSKSLFVSNSTSSGFPKL